MAFSKSDKRLDTRPDFGCSRRNSPRAAGDFASAISLMDAREHRRRFLLTFEFPKHPPCSRLHRS